MNKRLERFFSGPAIDRALALAGMVGLSTLIGLVGQIVDMAVDYPLPLSVTAAACFLLGVLFSYATGVRDARLRRWEAERADVAERRERDREERARAEAIEARTREAVMQMDFDAKCLLCIGYESGAPIDVYAIANARYAARVDAALSSCRLLAKETTSSGLAYTITPAGRSFLDANSDLLKLASEHVAENGGAL